MSNFITRIWKTSDGKPEVTKEMVHLVVRNSFARNNNKTTNLNSKGSFKDSTGRLIKYRELG